MADAPVEHADAAKPKDPTKPEMPKLLRTLSKGYQKSMNKTRDNFKKAFLTPRGARGPGKTDGEAAAPAEAQAEPEAPAKPVANGIAPTPTSVKATVQASSEGGPVEIKLEPVPDVAPPKTLPDPVAPATPPSAPASLVQALQSAEPSAPPMTEAHPEPAKPPLAPAAAHESKEVQKAASPAARQEPEESAPAGSEPPQVRVVLKGVQADAGKADAHVAEDQPVKLHVAPVKKRKGGKAKKAAVSLLAIAAASAVGLVVTGRISH